MVGHPDPHAEQGSSMQLKKKQVRGQIWRMSRTVQETDARRKVQKEMMTKDSDASGSNKTHKRCFEEAHYAGQLDCRELKLLSSSVL